MLGNARHTADAIDPSALRQGRDDLRALGDIQSVHDESILARASIVKRKRDYFEDRVYNPLPHPKMEDLPVTVCVAVRSKGNAIFGASDRMLTSGDVEFEPDTAKIIPITASIVVMTAGDSAFQAEILRELYPIIEARIKIQPENWWLVRDVAYLYLHHRNEIKKKRAEEAFLVPLGLDQNSFIGRQKEMADVFVTQLTKELVNFEVPSVEAIFAGIDEQGAHIYTVENETVRCHDSVGFAAIGIGYWHSNSQLMLAGHHNESPLEDSLLLTYVAKRRAEVAPGVGEGTDMFTIGPKLGSYTPINSEVLTQLGNTYAEMSRKEKQSLDAGRKEIQQYVARLIQAGEAAAATQEQATTKIDGGEKAPDGSIVPDNIKKDGEKGIST